MLHWGNIVIRNVEDLLTQLKVFGIATLKWKIVDDEGLPVYQEISFLNDKKKKVEIAFGDEMYTVLNTISCEIEYYGTFELDVESGKLTRTHLINKVVKTTKLKEPDVIDLNRELEV